MNQSINQSIRTLHLELHRKGEGAAYSSRSRGNCKRMHKLGNAQPALSLNTSILAGLIIRALPFNTLAQASFMLQSTLSEYDSSLKAPLLNTLVSAACILQSTSIQHLSTGNLYPRSPPLINLVLAALMLESISAKQFSTRSSHPSEHFRQLPQ